MLEKNIERRFVNGIRTLGGKAYKLNCSGNSGMPDRIVILPGGKIMFVELKTDYGKLTAFQEMRIKELCKLGAKVWLLSGMQEVENFLNRIREKPHEI